MSPTGSSPTGRAVVERVVDLGTAELIPDPARARGWTVAVDGVAQSYVDLADPAYLTIPFTVWIGRVLDSHRPGALSAVFAGGAGGTLSRYLAATRPGSTQTVFELDGRLVELVREHLELDAVPGLTVRVGDGLAGIAALPRACADAVVLDVFLGAHVATEFATVEFLGDVRRTLRPGGLCVANVWDLDFALRAVASAGEVFPHVLALAEPGVLMRRRPGNLVIAASMAELATGELAAWAESTGTAVRCLTMPQLAAVCGTGTPITAADPVVGNVAPVRRWGRGSRFT